MRVMVAMMVVAMKLASRLMKVLVTVCVLVGRGLGRFLCMVVLSCRLCVPCRSAVWPVGMPF